MTIRPCVTGQREESLLERRVSCVPTPPRLLRVRRLLPFVRDAAFLLRPDSDLCGESGPISHCPSSSCPSSSLSASCSCLALRCGCAGACPDGVGMLFG